MIAIGMRDDQDPFGGRGAYSDESLFGLGVIGIGKRQGKRVAKNGGRFLERDSMFVAIQPGFFRVPFEVHATILLYFCEGIYCYETLPA